MIIAKYCKGALKLNTRRQMSNETECYKYIEESSLYKEGVVF